MIACYAWTDTQLINLVQVVETSNLKNSFDLFVCMLDRISLSLLNQIKDEELFLNIYEVYPVNYTNDWRLFKKIPFLFGLISTIRRKKYYENYYSNLIGTKKYIKLITAGYWGDSLFLLKHLCSTNPNIEVELVEEGNLSYCSSKARLCQAKPFGCTTTAKDVISSNIIKALIFGKNYLKIDKLVKRIYFYEPKAAKVGSDCQCIEICKILSNSDNAAHRILNNISNNLDLTIDTKINAFFFLNPLIPGYEDDHVITFSILNLVLECLGKEHVMVKPHPEMLKEVESEVLFKEDIQIESKEYPFEAMAARFDLTNKILISRNTSCLLLAKFMFDYEPTILFTYRLYERYAFDGEPDLEWYVKGLTVTYKNKDKILVPNSMDDLKNMLAVIKETVNVK